MNNIIQLDDNVNDKTIQNKDKKEKKKVKTTKAPIKSLFKVGFSKFKKKLKKFKSVTDFISSLYKAEQKKEVTPLGAWISEFDQLGAVKM